MVVGLLTWLSASGTAQEGAVILASLLLVFAEGFLTSSLLQSSLFNLDLNNTGRNHKDIPKRSMRCLWLCVKKAFDEDQFDSDDAQADKLSIMAEEIKSKLDDVQGRLGTIESKTSGFIQDPPSSLMLR